MKFYTVWKPIDLRLTLVNANSQYKKLIGSAIGWRQEAWSRGRKIEAILQMDRPWDATALRGFTGAVNLYKELCQSRAHVLKPLTVLSGLKKRQKTKWTSEMEEAFNKMKHLLALGALRAYPNHNKRYQIYTDASDYQLGSCIVQDGMPITFFSKKLIGAHMNYLHNHGKRIIIHRCHVERIPLHVTRSRATHFYWS